MARRSFAVAAPNNAAKDISANWVNDLDEILVRGLAVTPQDFGAVADNVTDDYPAFAAAIAYLKTIGTAYGGFGLATPRLFVPLGQYYLSDTIDLTSALIIEGRAGHCRTRCDQTEVRSRQDRHPRPTLQYDRRHGHAFPNVNRGR
jgi:polygalacturonase